MPIINKTRIYLDTNYWIELQKQAEKDNPEEQKLLKLAYRLIDDKKAIFPISEITFWEILKQSDFHSRSKTFEIIDRLSGGFTTLKLEDLIYLQVKDFIDDKQGKPVKNLIELIWTKISLLQSGDNYPKEFQSFLANTPFSILHSIFGRNLKTFTWSQDIDLLNQECLNNQDQHSNSKDLFLTEIFGILDAQRPKIEQVMFDNYSNETGRQVNEEERKVSNLTGMIYECYKQNKITTELPHFTITADLYSAVRWNKGQRFDRNHTLDFLHASCALPFFHYFFTENQLCTLIHQRKLDKRFSCKVESKPNKVIELLSSLI